MSETKIIATIEHKGADRLTNQLFFDLASDGYKTRGGVSYEQTKTGAELGVMRVEIENSKAALKQLKDWIKASRFTAKVIV